MSPHHESGVASGRSVDGARPTAVHAVKYSTATSKLSSTYGLYYTYREPDGPITYDFFYWVIETPGGVVLFDTGFDAGEASRRTHATPMPIARGLEELGISTDDIRTVVLSHLHYDHCGNIDLFPNAEVFVQRAEWEFAYGPMSVRGQFASNFSQHYLEQLQQVDREGRIRLLDGDTVLAPGLEVILLPGHTAGLQGLVVDTEGGERVVLASDAGAFYDTWRLDRPVAIVVDVPDMYRSYERLRALEAAGATVVPAHDSKVGPDFGERTIDDGGGALLALVAAATATA
ncbi:N-acyl homoserine lactonase family protein [Rhodococcus sp. NPDC003322]